MLNEQCSWEHEYYPSYFFGFPDVPEKFLRNPKQGATSTTYDLVVGEHTAEGAVTVHTDGSFKDLVKIAFDKVDAWLEEDEEIYNHPRDPYKVRTLSSYSVAGRDMSSRGSMFASHRAMSVSRSTGLKWPTRTSHVCFMRPVCLSELTSPRVMCDSDSSPLPS